MSRENRNLIILAVSAVVLGLLFIVGLSTYNKKVTQQKTLKYYQTYISETKTYKSEKLDSGILEEKIILLDGETEVGYIFVASDTATGIPLTEGESKLRLHIFVSKDNKIKGVVVDYSEHTQEFVEKLTPYFSNLKDALLIDYKKVDRVAGASEFTEPIVIKALDQVTKLVTGNDPNPAVENNDQDAALKAYKSFFDLDSMEEVDLEGTVYQQVKISKDSNLVGYVYKAKGTNQRGLIDLAVGVKLDGTITGIKILESENTAGFYDQYIDSANNTLKGLQGGTSATTLTGIDNIAGVTQSGNLINDLLKAVAAEAKKHIEEPENPVDPYEEVFGAYQSKEEDSAFTTTETLTKKEIIKDSEGNILGFAYTATGTREGIPYHDGPARVTLLIGVKEDGTVLGIYKLKVEHTPTYFSYHDPFFENLKGKNISEYETVDTVAGATVSWGLIKELLDAVKEVS